MNTHITLGCMVPPSLEHSIRRQIEYKFASLNASITSVHVSLEKVATQRTESVYYACKMHTKLVSGQTYTAEMQGPHPNVCIIDAAARLARMIGRQTTLAAVRKHLP